MHFQSMLQSITSNLLSYYFLSLPDTSFPGLVQTLPTVLYNINRDLFFTTAYEICSLMTFSNASLLFLIRSYFLLITVGITGLRPRLQQPGLSLAILFLLTPLAM